MADISRSEVASLIAEEYGPYVLKSALASSTALAAFPTVNMGTKVTHLPVLASTPSAGWVAESATAAAGVKPQSEAAWEDRTLVAEEIAVIIPVHEDVVEDATEDLLEETAGLAGQAIGTTLDEAVLFGIRKPASWTSEALVPAARGAEQTIEHVGGAANSRDLYGATMEAAGLLANAGFNPATLLTTIAYRYAAANIRDANGNTVIVDNQVLGFDTYFNANGAWDATAAEVIVADPSRVRIGVRQDVTVKILDQATLGTGETAINLAERDMIALRVKARYAYVLGDGATAKGDKKVPVSAVSPTSITQSGGTKSAKASS